MRARLAPLVGVWLAATVGVWVLGDRGVAASAAAALAGVGIFSVGLAMIRGLAQPTPEPPDPGELRKVKLTYRCELCGVELRMTMAPQEDPDPPRHCQEPMTLVTPLDE